MQLTNAVIYTKKINSNRRVEAEQGQSAVTPREALFHCYAHSIVSHRSNSPFLLSNNICGFPFSYPGLRALRPSIVPSRQIPIYLRSSKHTRRQRGG